MLGGPNEKLRAADFMNDVQVLADVDVPEELTRLSIGGKIKPRSLTIFSFGIVHKALTVTANEGFIRSARMQVKLYYNFSSLNIILLRFIFSGH